MKAARLFTLTAALGLPALAAGEDRALARWTDTEVRFLLTDDERDAWGRLDDDASRRVFVDTFWARRDPTPGTPANEYRDAIAARVKEANRLFRGEGRPGWSTDRGRIYILFGPPDETSEDAAGAVREGAATVAGGGASGGGISTGRAVTRGVITWIYHRPANPELPPNTRFLFEADASRAYRLTSEVDPRWAQFSQLANPAGQAPGTTERAAPPPRAAAAAGDPAPGEALRKTLAEALAAPAGDSGPRIAARALVFPVGREEALVATPFELSGAAAGQTADHEAVWGVASPSDAFVHVGAGPFPAASPGTAPAPSFGLLLAPGDWRVVVVVRDRKTGERLGSTVLPVSVPRFDDGRLRLSTPVLARKVSMREAKDVQLDRLVDGVAIGNIGLDATPGNRVPEGSSPELFFVVAGAKPDESGTLAATAGYRILRDGQEMRRYPPQAVTGAFNAQPIPLEGLAPGSYQLEIELEDSRSGEKVQETIDFTVE